MVFRSAKRASELTEKQRLFVRAMARNACNQKTAAISAGYSGPEVAGSNLMSNPLIRQAISEERERYLCGEMASIALGTMRHLMTDQGVSAAVRFQSARWVLEAAGHNNKEIKKLGFDPDKPLTEMSLSELQAFIAAGSQAVESMKRPRLINADGPQTLDGQAERTDNAQDSAQSGNADDLT